MTEFIIVPLRDTESFWSLQDYGIVSVFEGLSSNPGNPACIVRSRIIEELLEHPGSEMGREEVYSRLQATVMMLPGEPSFDEVFEEAWGDIVAFIEDRANELGRQPEDG